MINPTNRSKTKGFALVVTLSLMILLTIIAVGLLTLSTVSLRASGQGESMATARNNARMALMLAIGELQRQTGPDTRVTARADVLDQKNPPVLGAWKSWEGTDHETTGNFAGRPISPGNYQSKKQARFLSWLVSNSTSAATSTTVPDTTADTGKAVLVGAGSVGEGDGRDKLQINLTPSAISASGKRGACAWWVGGENTKARLSNPYQPTSDTAARWSVNAKSHAVADPKEFRMDSLLDDAAPVKKAPTLGQSDLIATQGAMRVSREFFHDLSATSTGLLTNTATGGWRKDLSLVTENWTDLASSNLPFFRVTPDKDLMFAKPAEGNPVAAKSMIYPWADYRAGSFPIYQHGAVSSWDNLKDWATAYKRVSAASTGRITIQPTSVAIDASDPASTYRFLHKVRILPVIARIQWVFSHTAGEPPPPAAGKPANPAGSLEPRLLLTPVITMWNPYNVEITATPPNFHILAPLPVALQYTINGITNSNYVCLTGGSTNNKVPGPLSTSTQLNYVIRSTFTLKPGETRLFSPANAVAVAHSNTELELQPGYRSTGGHYFTVRDNSNLPIVAPGSSTINAKAKFDTIYNDFASANQGTGVGIYLDMSLPDSSDASGFKRHLVYRMVYTPEVANTIYKPLTQLAGSTLAEAKIHPAAFLSTVFGARMASRTHIPAKGFIQSSPLVNYTAMGRKDIEEASIARHYGGTGHPVNSPFDYSFIQHSPGGDSQLPNSDASNRGYIVTGFNKADGLSRCVIAELPTRPVQSLGELENWDLRYENPIPPFAFNLIGNSDATPLLPSNAVVNGTDASLSVNLQYDDSYCTNHLLFDDWFFSSIAPDPTAFGPANNIQQTFTNFINGTSPLGNRSYRPAAKDLGYASASAANANKLYADRVRKADSWRSVASLIEVEGMFNVNSTSVVAWRALLGHARNQRVPFIQESGTSWNAGLSSKSDFPVSRFSVAGDKEAKEQGSSGAFPEAAEFAGYRLLDDSLLDELAQRVVEQVRARGPFLSLSEFVNRQLSSGDLALAGTIQAALNKLNAKSSTDFYKAIENLSTHSVAVPERAAEAEYKYPAAAEGACAYGLPGWTRQADILRPLAPILSARDDTFTIRAYGDARDTAGKIVAHALCEAVVCRTRDYVDPTDPAETTAVPKAAVNKTFGRRYQILSFRWLAPSEA